MKNYNKLLLIFSALFLPINNIHAISRDIREAVNDFQLSVNSFNDHTAASFRNDPSNPENILKFSEGLKDLVKFTEDFVNYNLPVTTTDNPSVKRILLVCRSAHLQIQTILRTIQHPLDATKKNNMSSVTPDSAYATRINNMSHRLQRELQAIRRIEFPSPFFSTQRQREEGIIANRATTEILTLLLQSLLNANKSAQMAWAEWRKAKRVEPPRREPRESNVEPASISSESGTDIDKKTDKATQSGATHTTKSTETSTETPGKEPSKSTEQSKPATEPIVTTPAQPTIVPALPPVPKPISAQPENPTGPVTSQPVEEPASEPVTGQPVEEPSSGQPDTEPVENPIDQPSEQPGRPSEQPTPENPSESPSLQIEPEEPTEQPSIPENPIEQPAEEPVSGQPIVTQPVAGRPTKPTKPSTPGKDTDKNKDKKQPAKPSTPAKPTPTPKDNKDKKQPTKPGAPAKPTTPAKNADKDRKQPPKPTTPAKPATNSKDKDKNKGNQSRF